jgi:serine phosphatase RsbU (regulator of sigma subunit)/PAS domain-containing protein
MGDQETRITRAPVVSAREALEFLIRAGFVLADSLEYEQTLAHVVDLVVPQIADWCGVYIDADADADGGAREITSRHADPELEQMLVDIRRRRREQQDGSETLQVLRTGRSILATDIRDTDAPELDERQRQAVRRLGPRSYLIVPLRARGRVIGALTLLSTREGRHYREQDLAFAETLGERFALAIDNARLYEAAERSLGLLDTLIATAPVGLAFLDLEERYVRVNDALVAMNGRPVEDHVGRRVDEVPGPVGIQLAALHREVVASGEARLDREASGELPGRPGEIRHWISSVTPVRGLDGRTVIGVGATVIDSTERLALLQAEREARIRADFLARAGVILDSSLDFEETLANVASIATPEVADWCVVSILDGTGGMREVATANADPARRAAARELSERFPPDPESPTGALAVARSGETVFIPEITPAMLDAGVADPQRRALLDRLALRSVVIAPMAAGGRISGTLTLASAESGRLFDAADVQLAEELARRAGVAIENSRLYTERTRIAHTLQVRLLPERLPEIPGVVLAARYRAAGELNEVGGDFYDVFPRSETDWALVVGDVSGKGAEAAAITALARYSLRTAAMEEGAPSDALRRLNQAMVGDGSTQFATVVLAYISAAKGGGLDVRVALGGHPPPLVLRTDGRIDAPGHYGVLLGMLDDPHLHDCAFTLGHGDAMLLYTDGVTEAGSRDRPLGEHGLRDLLLGLPPEREPESIVDAVEQAVVGAQAGEPRDDIALLALTVSRA